MKQKPPCSIEDAVVATSSTSTTTSKQPYRTRDDDDAIAQVNFITHTNSLGLHVQQQLSKPARNMRVIDVAGNTLTTMSIQLQPKNARLQ
jgi:hypothetical protein